VNELTVHTLADDDAAAVERVLRRLCEVPDGRLDSAEFLAVARQTCEELPSGFRGVLRRFRRDCGPGGALLLRGMPIAESSLPRTPMDRGSVQRSATVPAAGLLLAALALGDPIAFTEEKSGALIHDVVPVPGMDESQSNAGSVQLTFHTENAFHPYCPDFVLLLCLRPDPVGAAGLRVAGLGAALPLLDEQTRQALFRPEFVTASPPSFSVSRDTGEPEPVLRGDPGDPDMRLDLSATSALTDTAGQALKELGQAFAEVAVTVLLERGDLAIVDNRRAVHGRTEFHPRYDGEDRWLQRVFVHADIRRSRSLRCGDGHVLAS